MKLTIEWGPLLSFELPLFKDAMSKLSQDQKATIVENDPEAGPKLRTLLDQVKAGAITVERAARLRSNIEGHALWRWQQRCQQETAEQIETK